MATRSDTSDNTNPATGLLDGIQTYLLKHFDMIGLDIHGHRMAVDMDGEELPESRLAIKQGTNFTPSVIFYDTDGNEALRLRGYYPPYRFLAALEFVADRHYREERFREYLARADVPLVFEPGDLIVRVDRQHPQPGRIRGLADHGQGLEKVLVPGR